MSGFVGISFRYVTAVASERRAKFTCVTPRMRPDETNVII